MLGRRTPQKQGAPQAPDNGAPALPLLTIVGQHAKLEGKLDIAGRRCGIILSGGNVDLDRLPWSKS